MTRVTPSAVLAAMADGIGDIQFASQEWVEAAREVLNEARRLHSGSIPDFTICEVGHNAPAYLHCGPVLAWHARITNDSIEVNSGELGDDECDFKMQGDHSVISLMARLQYQNRDPEIVNAARQRLLKLSRWKMHGEMPENDTLQTMFNLLHDRMAIRTMPRFVFMTPEWVATARHILCTRSASEKYAGLIKDINFTFSEEFTETPAYAFPDGRHGGFWVRCRQGQLTVGAGALPVEFAPADMLTKGAYTPVVPVGRTVNAMMTDDDEAEQKAYRRASLRFDKVAGKAPVEQSSPSGNGEMPPDLGRVFLPLHDELSKRTAGDLPADYENDIRPEWSTAQSFDRPAGYDPGWLRYDKVDIYGERREKAAAKAGGH